MASKHHKAIAGHVAKMRQHANGINDSADKIEQIMAALKGGEGQQDQQQPAQPQMMPGGVSPLGGQAQ